MAVLLFGDCVRRQHLGNPYVFQKQTFLSYLITSTGILRKLSELREFLLMCENGREKEEPLIMMLSRLVITVNFEPGIQSVQIIKDIYACQDAGFSMIPMTQAAIFAIYPSRLFDEGQTLFRLSFTLQLYSWNLILPSENS